MRRFPAMWCFSGLTQGCELTVVMQPTGGTASGFGEAHLAAAAGAVSFAAVQAVADAILYEGYLLYPYRRSSAKNRVRWQFGVLLPRAWARAQGLCDEGVSGAAESWWQQTQCLLSGGDDVALGARVRFLQLQRKQVEARQADGSFRPVAELRAGSRLELSFDEAVPREFDAEATAAGLRDPGPALRLDMPGGQEIEPLSDGDGRCVGRVVRTRWPATASVSLSAARCEAAVPLHRLTIGVENRSRMPSRAARADALRHSLLSCHVLLAAPGGSFISLLDPPEWAKPAAMACSNVHAFPVLVGEPGQAGAMLSSPIILPDYPQVAPESPGDLHDATEIDEILTLRTLALTDLEKQEARATDARAAAILDRVDGMPPEVLARLHGAIRTLAPAGGEPGAPGVMIAGQRVCEGTRVRLRPRRGADPHDMFLDGRTGRVEKVLLDTDGRHHLAVTLDGDPAADLGHWYGRLRYFATGEVEPFPGGHP